MKPLNACLAALAVAALGSCAQEHGSSRATAASGGRTTEMSDMALEERQAQSESPRICVSQDVNCSPSATP